MSSAAQFFGTYFLVRMDACASRLIQVEWPTEALSTNGFIDAGVIQNASVSPRRRGVVPTNMDAGLLQHHQFVVG